MYVMERLERLLKETLVIKSSSARVCIQTLYAMNTKCNVKANQAVIDNYM